MPVLESDVVWGTYDNTRTAYMDATDIAMMTMKMLRKPEMEYVSLASVALGLTPSEKLSHCVRGEHFIGFITTHKSIDIEFAF